MQITYRAEIFLTEKEEEALRRAAEEQEITMEELLDRCFREGIGKYIGGEDDQDTERRDKEDGT